MAPAQCDNPPSAVAPPAAMSLPPAISLRHFHSRHYTSPAAGPKLIVLGAVHGNEVAGTRAILRIAEALDSGALELLRGALTLVPITNPLAYNKGQRAGDRNLNRALLPTDTPQEYEDHIANWLCPLLAQHDVLLDLHSFQSPGQPFAMLGPQNNTGTLEPFAHAAEEEALIVRLGVSRVLDGWLATYARGVARRRGSPFATALTAHERYGIGTTETMRAHGGWAITLECGQHDDPAAPEVAWQAIRNTLAHLGMIDAPPPQPAAALEALQLVDVIDRHHPDDRFAREWASFDRLSAGTLIAVRADGSELRAGHDGHIVFPNVRAEPGNEWFYLAGPNPRFAAHRG